METVVISRNELKKIMRETFVDALVKQKDLIQDAIRETFEDIGLSIAIEQGRTGEYVDKKEFFQKLDSKIKGAK